MSARPRSTAHLLMNLRTPVRPDVENMALSALRKFGPLSCRALADGLGYANPSSVYRALECLREEGLVSIGPRVGQPGRLYSLADVERAA